MIFVDQGKWQLAEDEIAVIMSRTYSSGVYRFPALVALARLRMRRGDPDSEIPLKEARVLSVTLAELQRSVYIAALNAEQAWLGGSEADAQVDRSLVQLREVDALAKERETHWCAMTWRCGYTCWAAR